MYPSLVEEGEEINNVVGDIDILSFGGGKGREGGGSFYLTEKSSLILSENFFARPSSCEL